jgi:hypothetical protein
MFSEDFYNSLTDLIDRINEEEKRSGDKLGIVYTRESIEEVFREQPEYLNLITLSFDGKIVLTEDERESEDFFFEFLTALNEKGISKVLADMASDDNIEVLTDENGDIYYKPIDSYDLNYDPKKDEDS